MTADERQRRIDEIHRQLAEMARNKSAAQQDRQREGALEKELTQLQKEADADRLLDLPIMDTAVLRGPKGAPQGVPIMITMAMRAKLQALGYREDEIDNMTPSEAWKILGSV